MLSPIEKLDAMRTLLYVTQSAPLGVKTDLLLLLDDYNQSVSKLQYGALRMKVHRFLGTLTETEEGPDDWPEYAELLEALSE